MSELQNVLADLEAYSRKLTQMVSALDQRAERPTVVSLLQDLANADIGRILGLGFPPNWQGEDKELSQRIKSILEDIRKNAELAGAFVGQEAVPPALDFLVSGIRLNVEGRLHGPFGVISAGKAEGTACPARKWWHLWRREGD